MAGNLGLPTCVDIINEALSHLGVYGGGDPLAASDLQSAYFTLQAMVDGWGAQALTIYNISALPFSLTAGQQSYTLGLAGATPANNWVAAFLPNDFHQVTMTLPGSPALELPVAIATPDEWAGIALKSLSTNIVTTCWPDYGAAFHTLNFWPVPNASIAVTLYVPQAVQRFTATSNVIQFPPAYQEAITFELAIKLSSKFGAAIPAWLPDAWLEAKSNIKESNFAPIDQVCDDALLGGRGGGKDLLAFYEGR